MVKPANILIVDDTEVNRNVLHDLILTLGHTPILAENGLSALARIRKHPPDLVLLDILMPEMDGYEVLNHMKDDNSLRHIPVIMISALDEMESVVRCIEKGADDYLTKPFNPTLLKARISACLEKKDLRDKEEDYRRQIEDYNLNLEERVQKQVQEIISAQRARENLSRYLSPGIVDAVLKSKKEIKLGGERRKATILFTDIRGYTRLSQKMDVDEIVEMLNEHFTVMTEIIFQYKGTLDKFIGDSVMAVFGAPFSSAKDEYHAVIAAQEMQQATIRRGEIRKQKGKVPLHIGIGINTGVVISGNIGSLKRMDYTVIGDTVNIASRLQGIAKGGEIVIGEITYQAVKDEFEFEDIGEVSLKNSFHPVRCYRLNT